MRIADRRWLALTVLFLGGGLAQALGLAVGAAAASMMGCQPSDPRARHVTDALPAVALSSATVAVLLASSALAFTKLARSSRQACLGLTHAPARAYTWTVLGVLGAAPVGDALASWLTRVAPGLSSGALERLNTLIANGSLWILLPAFALLPAASEELFFRGMLQRSFGSGWLAIAISTTLFALFHIDPIHIAGVLPVGFVLAWAAARTGSTLVPMAGHLVNNAAAIATAKIPALHAGYGTGQPIPTAVVAVGVGLAFVAITRLGGGRS